MTTTTLTRAAPPLMAPYDKQAEHHVLNTILHEPWRMGEIELTPEDFYIEAYRWVYEIMRDIFDSGAIVDITGISWEADVIRKENPEKAETVWTTTLDLVQDVDPMTFYSSATQNHCQRLRKLRILRDYLNLASVISQEAYKPDSNPDLVHARIEHELRKMRNDLSTPDAALDWQESFAVHGEILERRRREAQAGEIDAWAWPWSSWDQNIGFAEPGMLITLAAGDGMGKTSYAECIAEHWARQGKRVLFVHFELNRELMLDRRLCRNARVARRKLRSIDLSDEELAEIEAANARMSLDWAGNITYLHTPGWNTEQTLREALRIKEQFGLDAIVWDYLEKASMSPAQVRTIREDSWRRETNDVEQIKNFVEQHNLRCVLLSQLNKAGKAKDADAVTRMDIGGSGAKTERANIVILLHRELLTNGQKDATGNVVIKPGGYSSTVNVIVNKNTMGSHGRFQQYFDGQYFDVRELAV